MQFVPSEYSASLYELLPSNKGTGPLDDIDFDLNRDGSFNEFHKMGLIIFSVLGGLTFVANPLVLKPFMPNSAYATRAVLGLGLLVPEFFLARYLVKQK